MSRGRAATRSTRSAESTSTKASSRRRRGHTPAVARTPLVVLWDAHEGTLRAIVEAFALGQLRTGRDDRPRHPMARPGQCDRVRPIGTGKQAMAQLAAMSAVRALDRSCSSTARSRTRRRCLRRRSRAAAGWPFEVREAASVEEAAREADIVTTATRARDAVPRLGICGPARS